MSVQSKNPESSSRAARSLLVVAALLFIVFCINIAVGKVAVLSGATEAPGLGDVGEFLVLFAAVVLFIIGCLYRESADKTDE